MSHTREMLDAGPTRAGLGTSELAAAIDACLDCLHACTACSDDDLFEDDVAAMRDCIALCLTCADICGTTARALSRASADRVVVHRLLQACVRECAECAEECSRHAEHHRHCAVCETVCRACVYACQELLDEEGFEELQKLAGG